MDYFTALKATTWEDVAALFDIELIDLLGEDYYNLPDDELFDCILLDELKAQHKQYVYDQTHFTVGISI